MHAATQLKIPLKPVVAALALAFAAVGAEAAPTPTQLPGAGLIRAVSTGTTITSPSTAYCVQTAGAGCVAGTGGAGDQIYNGALCAPFFPGSIQLNNAGTMARAVIQWGGTQTGAIDPIVRESYNPAGFNIGVNATVFFTSSATVTSAAVLNIDASGNPSQIFGKLIGTSDTKLGTAAPIPGVGGGAAPIIFVANANGIIVGPTGQIQAPSGVGLLGANMNTSLAINEFVANNGALTSYLDVQTLSSKTVDVQGFIDGGIGPLLSNVPAKFIMLVGGDIVNSGNLYAENITVLAGMRSYSTTTFSDTVGGISNTLVQRLYNVDTGVFLFGINAGWSECSSSPACLEIGRADSSFANTGSMSSKDVLPLGGGDGNVVINAAGSISTGPGNDDPLVGVFADSVLTLNAYQDNSTIHVRNVVGGYSLGVTMADLNINQAGGWGGDVHIDALVRGSAPSSIVTLAGPDIRGVNVIIDSTINHTLDTVAPFSDGDLDIVTTGSLAVNADIGAGDDVNITNSGAGGINIAGNVISDNDPGDAGGIFIANTNSAALTTISGNLYANGSGGVNVTTNGDLDITGSMYAFSSGGGESVTVTNTGLGKTTTINNADTWAELDVNITAVGPLDVNSWIWADQDANIINNSLASGNTTTIAGAVWAGNDVNIFNNGGISSNLDVMADVLAYGGWDGYSFIDIYSGGNGHLSNVVNSSGGGDADVYFAGLQASLRGAIDINDGLYYGAPYATTKFHTSASITAPFMTLEVLNLRGVQDDGSAYTDLLQKPGVQIFGDFIDVIAYGSVNSPIEGNTNWLLNDLGIASVTPGFPVQLDISAIGGGFQAINLSVDGDVGLTSGLTTTPFSIVGLTGSALLPPPLIANGGSQLIVQATGDMDVWGTIGPLWPLAPVAFQFPGGVVLKAGGYLSQNAPIYNAWTTVAQPWQGIFLESDTIIAGGYQATNGNSWVNYSSAPVTGPSTVYQITNPAPGVFGFVISPEAVHHNTYSRVVVGGAICTQPAPPWVPGC